MSEKLEKPESENQEPIKIEIPNKYGPLLSALKEAWDLDSENQTLQKSVMLMVYITHLSEQGHILYVQDPSGKTRELALLSKDDVSIDQKKTEREAVESLKNSLK